MKATINKESALKLASRQFELLGQTDMSEAILAMSSLGDSGSVSFLKQGIEHPEMMPTQVKSLYGIKSRCIFSSSSTFVEELKSLANYHELTSLDDFDDLSENLFKLNDTLIGRVTSRKFEQEYLANNHSDIELLKFSSKDLADHFLSEYFQQRLGSKIKETVALLTALEWAASKDYCTSITELTGDAPEESLNSLDHSC